MPVVTDGFALVPAPKTRAPITGLIPTLSDPSLADTYLIEDSDLPVDDTNGPRPMDDSDINDSARWEGGFRYAPENACALGGITDPCSVAPMVIPPNEPNIAAKPGLVWAGDKCSTLGWKARDYRGRAERLLLTSESLQVAHELWTGTQSKVSIWPNGYLASHATDVITNGPTTPLIALQLLEGALGTCGHGQQCMIHCTRLAVIAMAAAATAAFRRVGNLLLTLNDTIVCADAGYDGSGPSGQAAAQGSQWAYATTIPVVRRGPISVFPDTMAEATIKGTNLIEFRAKRMAIATFNPCCFFAAEINLPLPLIGGVS